MKKVYLIIAMLCMPVCNVFAQDTQSALSIVVVNTQELMSESKAAKSIQRQGMAIRKKYEKEIKTLEKDLKKAEEDLLKASKGKSKEDFLKKQKSFQEKMMESKKSVAEYNKNIDRAVGDALGKLRDEIVDIVEDVAEDKKYDLVLSNNEIITSSQKLDITDDIMKLLNEELSSVKVKD